MKLKKILRSVGKGLMVFICVLFAFTAVLFIYRQIRLRSDVEYLRSQGYYDPVSVGDYSLNLLDFGNTDGENTIVAMAGYGVPDCCITMRKMTSVLEEDNRVIFPDRAGYGASGDTKNEMTAEYIVEDYRKALANAGVEGPFVLMPHSIAGVYASYWVSKYPEEIKAIVFIDATEMESVNLEENPPRDTSFERIIGLLDKAGIGNIAIRALLQKNPDYSKDEQRIEDILSLMTYDSDAIISEKEKQLENIAEVWNVIVTTDIPKIYICSSNAFETKEEVLENGGLSDEEIYNLTGPYFSGSEEERIESAYKEYLSTRKYVREHILQPYAEKLGNCEIVYLPGDHLIYQQKPDECSAIIKSFLEGI